MLECEGGVDRQGRYAEQSERKKKGGVWGYFQERQEGGCGGALRACACCRVEQWWREWEGIGGEGQEKGNGGWGRGETCGVE